MDTHICMAEFPCCSPKTITASLIGYIPKQIKKKKKIKVITQGNNASGFEKVIFSGKKSQRCPQTHLTS